MALALRVDVSVQTKVKLYKSCRVREKEERRRRRKFRRSEKKSSLLHSFCAITIDYKSCQDFASIEMTRGAVMPTQKEMFPLLKSQTFAP